jgi:PAS domain S-box-containing protein
VGYLTLSEACVIQEANLAAATLLGVERRLLTGQRLTHFIHPEDQDTHYQAQRQIRSTRKPQSYELRLRCEQPRPACWVYLQVGLAPEPHASPASSCRIILVDITARKRVEQALRDSQERLRLVSEIADVSCWEWEPGTDHVMFPPDWHWLPSDGSGHSPDLSRRLVGLAAHRGSYTCPRATQLNSPPIQPTTARSSIGCGVGMGAMTGS